ncbi:MAG: CPBP family intramembrane metalloprotease [Chloroflexi bacterium]|nr:CPBP family intramembrane metalloprotease [Chloroflexota bacterium]
MQNNTTENDGLWAFFGLTFVFMALTFGVMALFQIPGPALSPAGEPRPLGLILFALGGFSPSLAGMIMAGVKGELGDLLKRSVRFGLGVQWYLVIIGLTMLPYLAQLGVTVLQGGSLGAPFYASQPLIVLANIPAILIFGPISEELGWRGFATDRVLARWNLPVANLILGLFWAFWHFPLFFTPGTSQQQLGDPIMSFTLFSIQIVALNVLYTWVYLKTDRSVWGAIFFHFMSAFAPFTLLAFLPEGGSFINLVSIGVYVVAAVIVLVAQMSAAETLASTSEPSV